MPRRIHLLFITTSISTYGGIEETLRILCDRLNPTLFRIGLCAIQDHPHEILEEFREMGVETYCLHRTGYFFDLITTLRVSSLIKQFKADIVHTHNDKGNLHGRAASFIAGKPAIVTTHHDLGDILFSKNPKLKTKRSSVLSEISGVDPYQWTHKTLYPFLNIGLNRLNAKVITVSNAVRDIYTSDPLDAHFETVYAPYDETIFRPNNEGFKTEKVTLGTVGRFCKQKGYVYLLQAMKLLVTSRSDIALRIIGDGPLRSDIETFVEENGLTNFVTLCGPLPHDAHLYDDIDIYIQPSVSEGCSITLLEAMGVGIPVIAGDTEGPGELIIPNETGILVPLRNPHALKDAVLHLIENREKARTLGRAGNRRAMACFSATIFIERMTRIYQGLVNSQ